MKPTLYSKLIQSLVEANDNASLLLAHLLVDDPKALLLWSWMHNNAIVNSFFRPALAVIGLPSYGKTIIVGNVVASNFPELFSEGLKHMNTAEYVLNYKNKHYANTLE